MSWTWVLNSEEEVKGHMQIIAIYLEIHYIHYSVYYSWNFHILLQKPASHFYPFAEEQTAESLAACDSHQDSGRCWGRLGSAGHCCCSTQRHLGHCWFAASFHVGWGLCVALVTCLGSLSPVPSPSQEGQPGLHHKVTESESKDGDTKASGCIACNLHKYIHSVLLIWSEQVTRHGLDSRGGLLDSTSLWEELQGFGPFLTCMPSKCSVLQWLSCFAKCKYRATLSPAPRRCCTIFTQLKPFWRYPQGACIKKNFFL